MKNSELLKEASKRVQNKVDALSVDELLKIDLYTFKNELMDFYIKEIQKEIKENK